MEETPTAKSQEELELEQETKKQQLICHQQTVLSLCAQQNFHELSSFFHQFQQQKEFSILFDLLRFLIYNSTIQPISSVILRLIQSQLQNHHYFWTSYIEVILTELEKSACLPAVFSDEDAKIGKDIFFNHFHHCNPNIYSRFYKFFQIPVDVAVALVIRDLAQKDKFLKAFKIMTQLQLMDHMPVDQVFDLCLKHNRLLEADKFAGHNKARQRFYIELLLKHSFPDKLIKKRFSKFKVDVKEFPRFYRRRQEAALRFLIHSEKFDVLEDAISDDVYFAQYVCSIILQKHGIDHFALQYFVFKFNLMNEFRYVNVSPIIGKTLKDFTSLDNPPIRPESFFYLHNFIDKEHVRFVDTEDQLIVAFNHLIQQETVGFDCEWNPISLHSLGLGSTSSNLGHGKVSDEEIQAATSSEGNCSLLQISSAEMCFVIDSNKLLNVVGKYVEGLFVSKKVLKIGFDMKSDLHAIRLLIRQFHESSNSQLSTFKPTSFNNLLDLQSFSRQIRHNANSAKRLPASLEEGEIESKVPGDTSRIKNDVHHVKNNNRMKGLSDLTLEYSGLSIDKTVRMSNWDRRPLSEHQFHYAALDAFVLVYLYQKMKVKHGEDIFHLTRKEHNKKKS